MMMMMMIIIIIMHQQISCNSITPRDMVYLGNVSVNTLHKAENVNN